MLSRTLNSSATGRFVSLSAEERGERDREYVREAMREGEGRGERV